MRVGLANGCFDLFHDGHRTYLGESARQCDYLVVAVNSDASVQRLKGKTRPHWTLATRIQAVNGFLYSRGRSFGCLPFEGDEGQLLMSLRPDVLFKGYDHTIDPLFYRRIGWKRLDGPAFEGPEIVQIKHLPGVSTSILLGETDATA